MPSSGPSRAGRVLCAPSAHRSESDRTAETVDARIRGFALRRSWGMLEFKLSRFRDWAQGGCLDERRPKLKGSHFQELVEHLHSARVWVGRWAAYISSV